MFSSPLNILCGVPQGLVLEPLLCTLYTIQLLPRLNHCVIKRIVVGKQVPPQYVLCARLQCPSLMAFSLRQDEANTHNLLTYDGRGQA